MSEPTLYRIGKLESPRQEERLVALGVLVPVELDAIDIAARLSVEKYPHMNGALVFAIVIDALAMIGGDDE